jgi:hypothetical protein
MSFEKGGEMTSRSAKMRVPADSLGTLSELASGGQGRVYEVSGGVPALRALPYTDLVYKEYNRSTRAKLNPDMLDEMAQYAAQLTSGPEGLGDRLAWPLATVEREGALSGFLMRHAPQQFAIRLQLPRGKKLVLAEAQLLLNDEQYLADRKLPVHDQWRLQFLRDTADTLAQLHWSGITVGDLSPKNLLASFTTRPYCFFLDCDTMQMAGRSVLDPVETPGWEVPSGELRSTIASDAYKLAPLAARLFAGDQDSKDVTALSAVYPPLGQLAQLGMSTDPSVRPTPANWLATLDAATPHATTALPLSGVAPPRGARTTPHTRDAPITARPGPGGLREASPGSPPLTRAPTPNNLGRIFRIAVAALVASIFLIGVITQAKNWLSGSEPSADARLVLSTSQVQIGDTYFAAASGFSPWEDVRFSWTGGPTNGEMGVFPADSSGSSPHGPILERDPPGNYTITATGLTSGRTASAGLQVVTGTGAVRLILSTSQVKIGDTYFATAWGFSPWEDVRFSWTGGPTNGEMGVFPADSSGSSPHGPILERDPPGNYTITATGLTSGRTASAGLQVVQPGS